MIWVCNSHIWPSLKIECGGAATACGWTCKKSEEGPIASSDFLCCDWWHWMNGDRCAFLSLGTPASPQATFLDISLTYQSFTADYNFMTVSSKHTKKQCASVLHLYWEFATSTPCFIKCACAAKSSRVLQKSWCSPLTSQSRGQYSRHTKEQMKKTSCRFLNADQKRVCRESIWGSCFFRNRIWYRKKYVAQELYKP